MTGPRVLKEEPQYRLLFLGQVLSVLGDRLMLVVLPFAVLSVGGSVGDVAVVSAAQFLPFALLSLPAGVWADRLDRKRILIVADVTRMLCQLVAGLALLGGHGSVVLLVVVAAAYGAADAFFAPAFTGLLPLTVGPHNLQPANALRGLSYSVGMVAGPVLAAALIAFAGGPGAAMLFDAGTFLVSVLCLIPLRPRAPHDMAQQEPEDTTATTGRFWTSLREGWGEVRRRSWVLGLLGAFAVYHALVLPAVFVIGPVIADRDLSGATSWAWITVGFGLGSMLGDLLMLRWRPTFALRVSALMLAGASLQAIVLGSGLGTAAIAGLELLTGICVTGAFTLWETSLQEHVPDRVLSRVASYDYLTSAGMIPLGNLVVGGLATVVALRPLLAATSAVAIVFSLGVALLPAVRNLPRGRMTDSSPWTSTPSDGS